MRQIRLNLALGASLIIFAGTSAAGQEAAPAPQEQIEQPTEASVEPQPDATPEPVAPRPVPQTLDDLIPQSATDDAEGWAAQGADEVAGPVVPVEYPADEALDPSDPLFDIDGAIDSIAIPTPDPLTPDPDRPSFADIAAPDLIDLPELADVEVSDELTLAFPAEAGLFPEQDEFVARFRALSAIEALESDDDTVPQLAARARSDEALLSQMLRTYGYYDGEVVHQLSGGRRGFARGEEGEPEREVDNSPSVRFDVIPSVRYSFGTVDLGALDDLGAPDGSDLRDVFGIKPGDPLYADRIITQQAQLRLALGETGYPFATMDEPDLLIDHARQEGDLTLPVNPRGKYEFAEIASSDPAFLSNRHLQRIARFDPGDTYATSLQSDLRRAILATGLVSSVVITPRETVAPTDDQPGQLALDVEMERAPLRTISGAIGYGTEDGIKVEAGWEHRNLFPPEGALRLRGIVGTREQLASVTYRRNNFRDRDQILTIDAYASDIETDAVDARTVALRGAFERVSNLLFQKPLSWSVGAEALYTDERNRVISGIERPRQTYLIGALFGSATLDSSDDLLDPSEGFRLTGFLGPEVSRSIGTETFYLRAQVDGSMYHDVGPAVIAGRVRLATIQGAEAFEIAPSRRLYSGGGGSVRGYGYQAIGPLNDLGEPTGGASQVEVGVEARIQTGFLDGAVEVVPFFDAGSVSLGSTPDFRFVKYGAGVGIRYKTTFGPIRADLGVPLNPGPFDAPVVLYVSLGQAF
ncbi:MAG: outer membrane protein assembly factor [Erythrobacteraceae bacterium]|nr:outer membrane protein assembly factor [Erythrobacteraceae bacterium]